MSFDLSRLAVALGALVSLALPAGAATCERMSHDGQGYVLCEVPAAQEPALRLWQDGADGAPLRLFDAAGVKVDLSKRSHEDMGFWHRNVDFHEIIFCFKGALRWETEMGTVILKEGDMMVIPKGITHRSALCEESADENILLELKVRDELVYVGDDH